MVLPEVVGYKVHGAADKFITSTDIVLTVTKVGGRLMQLFQHQSALSITDVTAVLSACARSTSVRWAW